MSFKPVESLSEQIASHLAKKIIKGELKSKERVQELRIASELDVSRGSVREALLILERRHLVDIIPRRGALVTEITIENITSLYEVYGQLLELLISKVTVKWENTDLETLVKKFEVMRTAKSSGEQLVRVFELGFEIMEQGLVIVDNPYLTETLANFKPIIQRTYYLALQSQKGDLQDSVEFFGSLLDSVLKRDVGAGAEIIRVYVETQLREVLNTLES